MEARRLSVLHRRRRLPAALLTVMVSRRPHVVAYARLTTGGGREVLPTVASDRFEGSSGFGELVDAFADECARLGHELRPAGARDVLAGRVRELAQQLGVTHATVIRSYLREHHVRSWARERAGDLEIDEMVTGDTEPVVVDVAFAGELVAALGRVVHYATEAARGEVDVAAAHHLATGSADALTGLGLAVSAQQRGGGEGVAVERGQLVVARRALEGAREGIRTKGWSCCLCGEDHGQATLDGGVAERLGGTVERLNAALARS